MSLISRAAKGVKKCLQYDSISSRLHRPPWPQISSTRDAKYVQYLAILARPICQGPFEGRCDIFQYLLNILEGAPPGHEGASAFFFCAIVYRFSRWRRSFTIFSKPASSSFRLSALDMCFQFFTASGILVMYSSSNTAIFCAESCSTGTSSIGSAKEACAETNLIRRYSTYIASVAEREFVSI